VRAVPAECDALRGAGDGGQVSGGVILHPVDLAVERLEILKYARGVEVADLAVAHVERIAADRAGQLAARTVEGRQGLRCEPQLGAVVENGNDGTGVEGEVARVAARPAVPESAILRLEAVVGQHFAEGQLCVADRGGGSLVEQRAGQGVDRVAAMGRRTAVACAAGPSGRRAGVRLDVDVDDDGWVELPAADQRFLRVPGIRPGQGPELLDCSVTRRQSDRA